MKNTTGVERENLFGILWMTAAMAAFAIEDAFIKTVTKHLPVGQVLILFGVFGALVFALWAKRVGAPLFNAAVLNRFMLLRAVFEFFGRLFHMLALALTPMSSTTAILQAAPILVVIGASAFFSERVPLRSWLAIVGGLLGVLVIVRPVAGDFSALSLLAVVGTLGFVGRDLATRALSVSVKREVLGFYGFSTMVFAGACFAAWDAKPFVELAGNQLATIGAALIAGIFGYTALMTAMRTGSISIVSPFRYTRLIFGVSIGVGVFGEQLDLPMFVGGAVVIGAGLYIWWQGKVASAQATDR
jgi:drug/metabolite transporter (DMT)-like permease